MIRFSIPILFFLCSLFPIEDAQRSLAPFALPGTISTRIGTTLVQHRISQVPGESFPYLCPALRPRSVRTGLAHGGQSGAIPLTLKRKTPTNEISRLNHTASIHAVYASSRTLPCAHARLASGCWLSFAGRDSNPLISYKWFPSSARLPPLPDLSWRDRVFFRGFSRKLL